MDTLWRLRRKNRDWAEKTRLNGEDETVTEKERMDGNDETGLEDKTGGRRRDSDGKERLDRK